VLVLPYTHVFQSGVLFLGYSFGVPVVATDVGSLADDVVEGETGFLCRPGDAADLARAIKAYLSSDLCRDQPERSAMIRRFALERHSWDIVVERTATVYESLAGTRVCRPSSSNPQGHTT
jgi:glycosyltransferase involved in cell wall biosynthesis